MPWRFDGAVPGTKPGTRRGCQLWVPLSSCGLVTMRGPVHLQYHFKGKKLRRLLIDYNPCRFWRHRMASLA